VQSPDAVLVCRALAGDNNSFDVLMARYKELVHRIAYKMTGSVWEAQDLTQEAFLQAYVKLDQLAEPARFGGWLRALAANTCKMWLRRQRANTSSLETMLAEGEATHPALASDASEAVEEITSAEQRQALQRAVGRLSEKNRLAVWLHYFEGRTCAEVAGLLEVPVSTVAGRLHKSRKILGRDQRLRRCFGPGHVSSRAEQEAAPQPVATG